MPISQIFISVAIGLSAGVASGLFGIGGGIIIVPLLLYFFNFEQHFATGTSLMALLLPVGILGIWNYYKSGYIQIEHVKIGGLIALGMFLGTFFGSKVATSLQSSTLTKSFAVFLVLVAVRLWIVSNR